MNNVYRRILFQAFILTDLYYTLFFLSIFCTRIYQLASYLRKITAYSPQIQFRCYFPFVFMLTYANEINASRMRETDDKMRDNIKSHQILPRRTNVFSRADTESTANFVSPRLITSDNFNIFDLHPQPVCSPQMKVTKFPTRTSRRFVFFFFFFLANLVIISFR